MLQTDVEKGGSKQKKLAAGDGTPICALITRTAQHDKCLFFAHPNFFCRLPTFGITGHSTSATSLSSFALSQRHRCRCLHTSCLLTSSVVVFHSPTYVVTTSTGRLTWPTHSSEAPATTSTAPSTGRPFLTQLLDEPHPS